MNLFAQAAEGSGDVTRLTTSPNVLHANSVSPNGARFEFTETAPTTAQDIMELRLDGTGTVSIDGDGGTRPPADTDLRLPAPCNALLRGNQSARSRAFRHSVRV